MWRVLFASHLFASKRSKNICGSLGRSRDGCLGVWAPEIGVYFFDVPGKEACFDTRTAVHTGRTSSSSESNTLSLEICRDLICWLLQVVTFLGTVKKELCLLVITTISTF